MQLYEPLLGEYGTKSSAEVAQRSSLLSKSPADMCSGRSRSKIWLS